MPPYHAASQRGFTLMEALVALVVAAVGILAVVAVQLRALGDTRVSVHRAQAIGLIDDLSERMRANPNALVHMEDYAADWGSGEEEAPPDPICSAACTPEQLARYDVWAWRQNVAAALPNGHAAILLAPAGSTATNDRRQVAVLVGWREPRDARLDDAADGDAFFQPTDAVQSGGAAPEGEEASAACGRDGGFTCHLQYLAVPARCAPYRVGTSVSHHCAGA